MIVTPWISRRVGALCLGFKLLCTSLLLGREELHVPFSGFPWIRAANIAQLTAVEWPSADHLYWPMLDVDLAAVSIRTPADVPLVSRLTPSV